MLLVEGTGINLNLISSAQILVSKNIADKLLLHIDDKVILSFVWDQNRIKKRFTICGIYNTGLEEYDRRFCCGRYQKLQKFWNGKKTKPRHGSNFRKCQ